MPVPLSSPPSAPPDPDPSRQQALRQVIAELERGHGRSERPRRVATGFPAVDQDLPDGGLALGAVHEISGPLAYGFAARILSHLSGPVLWFRPQRERTLLYAPALQAMGCRVEHWLIAYTPTPGELLWGLEEGLRSGAVEAVVGAPEAPLTMTASRRLQLAAERGKALGLILSGQHRSPQESTGPLSPSTLTSRWHIHPEPGPADTARWQVHLLKLRGAHTNRWTVDATPLTGDPP